MKPKGDRERKEFEMPSYSEERKASVLKKMLPPHNQSVTKVSREEGISDATLYNWRTQAKQQGSPVPGSGKTSGQLRPS
ncbi:MAG: hypothetical protein COB71_10645 [Thiotrichales bacterium]|nr:MAG: hypothetical protein COB71_10645 [Thiotrichales bacterium]